MTLRSLQPIKFEPIWAQYETWVWQRQSDWSLANSQSDCLRRMYIEEQRELAKEKRMAEAQAKALRSEIESVVMDLAAAGVIFGK